MTRPSTLIIIVINPYSLMAFSFDKWWLIIKKKHRMFTYKYGRYGKCLCLKKKKEKKINPFIVEK